MDDIVLPDLTGRRNRMEIGSGKVLRLTFLAGRSQGSRDGIPALERLRTCHNARALNLMAVNPDEPPDTVRAFRKEFRLTFPLLPEQYGEPGRHRTLRSIPTTYQLDEPGIIIGRMNGMYDWNIDDIHRRPGLLSTAAPRSWS